MTNRILRPWLLYTILLGIFITILSLFFYWIAYTIILLTGLLISGVFLFLHRPTSWKTIPAIDSSAWIILVFGLYLRATIALFFALIQGKLHYPGLTNHIISILFGIPFDGILVLRLIHWVKFKKPQIQRDGMDPL